MARTTQTLFNNCLPRYLCRGYSHLLAVLIIVLLTLNFQSVAAQSNSISDEDEIYQYIREPVPVEFSLGQSYPSRNETSECRPIRLRIIRNSHQFRTRLVTNNNPYITFSDSDSRVMTSRLQTRLNDLAGSYFEEYSARITVLKAWIEYSDDDGIDDPYSLHYEGRTVRVHVPRQHISDFLKLAVSAGFDWVYYASYNYVRLSVIPDVCSANVDLVFMLDQSGSVGQTNHDIALDFLEDVVAFYNISANATQVGLITFSSGARVQFQLNEHTDITSLQTALSEILYTGGWTTTALALLLAQLMLNPSRGYGARASSSGIPKIAVLLTDGRSNIYPIRDIANLLRNSGVQVYTVGIGNVYLDELKFIASDPDPLHVFLLNSFEDAPNFVDFLSFTACDTPAIVEPGENTTSDVEEDGFRFFQSECPAFSVTIMIEQIDLVGTCSLYASTVVQNPGPLSPSGVVRNEDRRVKQRSVHLNLPYQHRFVYWSVRGLHIHNQFSVIIWDMIFQEDSFTVYVLEGVSGLTVFNLNDALRMTNVTFNYTISSGDELGFFTIDPQTGDIVTANPLDANVQDSFMLTIVAQNSEYSCHRGRVIINVIVLRDRIEFPPLAPISIPENFETGTPITQVQVSGADSSIVYSIVSGNVGNAFAINDTTGIIQVSSPLDFESLDSYSLTVQGMSSTTGNTGIAVQVVNIVDVNEQPFFVTQCAVANTCEFSVMENATVNTLVDTIDADDPDRPSTLNGMITFNIEGDVPFIVTQTGITAAIRTNSVLSQDITSYTFNLVVRDRGSPSLEATTTITVRVTDVNNNAPVFTFAPAIISVFESAPEGTNVTQFIATDVDQGINGVIVYNLSSSQSPIPFEINSENGVLSISEPLDFEVQHFYTLTITASNPDGRQTTSTQTVITVLDVNDNPPIFSQDVYFGSIAEHSIEGSAIVTVVATDEDSGLNGEIDFEIVSGNVDGLISLTPISSSIGSLTVNGDINREVLQSFTLNVTATDRGLPQMSDTAQVIITVTDINDNAPNFLPDSYEISIREDASPPFNILSVFVFDLDEPSTPNTQVDFEITNGNNGSVFSIVKDDDNTATLRLIGQLEFETQAAYELILTATDRGTDPGPQSSTATVIINVMDVNILPPNVTDNQTIEISEGEQVGTPIAQVEASDPDSPEITFEIVSVQGEGVSGEAAMGIFNISNDGIVSLAEMLDFETSTRYEIKIAVTDGSLTTTTTLVVIVVNENELPPVVTTTSFSVTEEQANGTIVGTVLASDLDAEPSETITFSIINSGRTSNLFSIGEETGILRTTQILDRESLVLGGLFVPGGGSSENLTIQAVDGGMPRLTSRTQVSVTLIDINDNPPVFERISNNSIGAVFENMDEGEVVVNAVAVDDDLGASGTVVYSLEVLNLTSGMSPPFEITGQGLVRTTVSLNREEQDTYSVRVRAADTGASPMTTVVVITIRILDRNDHAPEFTQNVYPISVLETTSTPEQLLAVSAFDNDEGSNGDVRYSIISVEPVVSQTLFSINNETGVISLEAGLDFETSMSHTITVRALDQGTPPMSSTTQVDITVVNVDEIPPEFIGPCGVLVRESVDTGMAITTCIATDIDDTSTIPGFAVRYELLEGNVGGAFSISNDGTVRVAAPVDRETLDFYSIVVRATDVAGLSTTTFLNITIDDVNDNPPIISNLPANRTISVAEIASHTREVFSVAASDADIGLNAELVYSLTTVIQTPGDPVTEITVNVSDRGTTPGPMATFEMVQFVFEEPCTLQQYSIDSSGGQITADLLCSVEVIPSVAEVTISTDFVLLCPIVRNIPVEYSWLHNGTQIVGPISLNESSQSGQLLITSATFQDAGQYTCRVVSAIGSVLSMAATVRIQVPPVITIPPISFTVEVGRIVTFRCFATGIPTPTISWSRVNPDGSVVVLNATNRILPVDNFLTIANLEANDQGTYICTASNNAGQATASASLMLFGLSNVVILQVDEFSMPSAALGCHELNTTQFEGVMTDITGLNTMVTAQDGDNVCNQTACSPSPCINGGSCDLLSDDMSGLGYVCTCPVGYTGVNCDTDINECDTSPCLSGGTCTNTDGSFSCSCSPGTTGHRCQYTTICDSQPCPSNQTCVATVANVQGYVCEEVSGMGVVVTSGGQSGVLDDQVNNLQEIQQEMSSLIRRKRQSDTSVYNDFVTTCEARFIPRSEPGEYLLLWACPQGVESPSESELDEICNMLFSSGMVKSCNSPTGLSLTTSEDQLPSTTLSISFILVSADGSPLSGREALALLIRTAALEKLRAQGYQATNFTTAIPSELTSASEAVIIGLIVAISVAVVTAALIFCIVIFVVKQRKSKKKIVVFDNSQSLQSVYSLNSDPCDDDYVSSSYVSLNQAYSTEHTFTFGTPTRKPSESTPTHTEPEVLREVFDDDIYGKGYIPPSATKSPLPSESHSKMSQNGDLESHSNGHVKLGRRRSSTLRRSIGVRGRKPSLNKRTESHDNLLDIDDSGDYDTLENYQPTITVTTDDLAIPAKPPRKVSSEPANTQYVDDEVIYGNMAHTQAGAHGNAGERWESYWKTHTLLRSPDPSHDTTHNGAVLK